MRNGDYGLVEVKLGGKNLIEEGVATLNGLASIMDPERAKKPAFKMILTATGPYAYERPEDGIVVCPISALKP